MSKKSFAGGLDTLLTPTANSYQDHPDTEETEQISQSTESPVHQKSFLKKGETHSTKKTAFKDVRDGAMRITFIVDHETCQKIKALAYCERIPIGQFVEQIFDEYLQKKDKKALEQIFQDWKKKFP